MSHFSVKTAKTGKMCVTYQQPCIQVWFILKTKKQTQPKAEIKIYRKTSCWHTINNIIWMAFTRRAVSSHLVLKHTFELIEQVYGTSERLA